MADRPSRAVSVAAPEIESYGGRYLVVTPSGADLADLAAAAASGEIRVPIALSRPIRDTRAAYERLRAGGIHGKLALDAATW